MSYFREFGATNKPGTCVWCGRKLRRYRYHDSATAKERGMEWGDYGDGFLCGLRCGYKFAVAAAKNGYRFKPKKTEE